MSYNAKSLNSGKRTPFTQDGSLLGCEATPDAAAVHDLQGCSSAGERRPHTTDVAGSIPATPTNQTESTTHKGDVAEMLVAAELLRRGYRVSRPLSNGCPYDLILDDGRRLYKIQVKAARKAKECIRAVLCSSKWHRGRTPVLYYTTCDAVIVVETDSLLFFVFSGDDLKSQEMRLRTFPAKNNQEKGIRNAADYDLSKMFPPKR